MKDQVRAMTRWNVTAIYVGEVERDSDREAEIYLEHYQLIFFSPESLLDDD